MSSTPNAQIMAEARAALSGRWKVAIAIVAIQFGIMMATNLLGLFGAGISVMISGPLALGIAMVFLRFLRGEPVRVGNLFDGFAHFATCFCAYFLMSLFILLWALLLIVPGIIAAYAYSMTFYILADEPQLRAREALRKSKIMMFGNKWKFCCLGFRFSGWFLLGIVTLGIGFLWIVPYISASLARFYLDIRDLPVEPAVSGPGLAFGFDDQ
ncbi:DUF975 family protein [Paludibacterium purpuratum]|nr:DUF975 family protein [Paludibacterium purpuratum]